MRRTRTLAVGLLALAIAGGTAATAVAGCLGDPLTATLSGSAETPAGDPDGTGKVRVTSDLQEGLICWSITFKGISKPTGAHIHKAAAGSAGPVVIPISTPSDKGAAKGCTAAGRALIKDIVANPDQYYLNIHTADFPAGAIRGQLAKA